jgi:hypothetical protein
MSETKSPSSNVEPKRFFGKYRGTVSDNIDPMQMGRIMAQVPDVLGEMSSSWAMPCVPAAGIQAGCFIVPPMGSQVWMEFEQGNPDYPIWTGGFWGTAADAPALALVPPPVIPPLLGQNIVLQTTGQNTLLISDAVPTPATGGIILKAAGGPMLVVNSTGIYITAGPGLASIWLTGPMVAINETALTITGP